MNILLIHKISVWLFITIYLVKTILLFTNNKEGLTRFSKMVKVQEMIVSTLFLLTGIYMFYLIGAVKPLQIIKIIAVLAAIPLAVVAYKKYNKGLAAAAFFLILMAYGLAEMSRKQSAIGQVQPLATGPVDGKLIFENNCVLCHGADGAKEYNGAANLHTSMLDKNNIISIVTNGKNTMMPYKELLSAEEIEAVSTYIITLR